MGKMNAQEKMTLAEWREEGKRRFGPDQLQWRFICPSCGHIASTQDWKDAGAPVEAVAFSCVGRWSGALRRAFNGHGKGPCDYAGGGLFGLNPVQVIVDGGAVRATFEFAPAVSQERGGSDLEAGMLRKEEDLL